MTTQQKTARRKGLTAAVVAGASGLAIVAGAPFILILAGLAGAGYLTYDWFMFRAKNGMRF